MFRTNLAALIVLSFLTCVQGDDTQKTPSLGTLLQTLVVIDGKDIPVGPSTLAIIKDDEYTVTVNGELFQKGTTKADHTKTPTETVTKITKGEGAGSTLLGILKIEGDIIINCIGKERPTEFKSKPGSGHTLMVWVRVK